MTRNELKQIIRETIEGVQAEAAKVSPSGTTYTFNQLNKLLRANKIIVFIKSTYDQGLIQIDNEDGFFMDEGDDGDQAVHAAGGGYKYEFGADFEEVYVAQKVNLK
jgi:hypothetical protein